MNKKALMWLALGWGLAIVLPPQRILAMVKGK